MSVENNFKQTEIGLIPEDWEVVRLGDVVEVKAGQSAPQGEKYFQNGKYPFIRVQHIDNSDYKIIGWDLINDIAVKDYCLKLFPKDTIVFPKSGATVYLEKRAMLPFNAYIVSHLCAINSKSENLLQKFLFYFFVNQKLANKKAEGYPTLNLSEIKGMLIPLPPLEEQRKIAKVLDKIQQAIEVQDKIIQQVKNLKKSLMQKLFTEGLYGEEQKETEIGLIPKSWEVVRLKDIAKIKLGRTPERKEKKYWENGSIPWVKISDLNNSVIYYTSENISNTAFKEKFKEEFIPKGTLLFSFKLTIGKVGILGIDAVHHEGIASLFVKEDRANKKFLFYLLQSLNYDHLLDTYVKGKTLNKEKLSILPIPLPPLEEQKQIAHILSTIDKKIEVEQKRKEILKELFKTMLHKLMSGEIRLKDVEI
ncbi:MAG: restriction endonuclease subunit S [Thermosulfidibacteraceae bacterium]